MGIKMWLIYVGSNSGGFEHLAIPLKPINSCPENNDQLQTSQMLLIWFLILLLAVRQRQVVA